MRYKSYDVDILGIMIFVSNVKVSMNCVDILNGSIFIRRCEYGYFKYFRKC